MIGSGIFVGVESYPNHANLNLTGVVKLCEDLSATFSRASGEGEWKVASTAEIRDANRFRATVREFVRSIDSDALIYLAGHGLDQDGDVLVSTTSMDIPRNEGLLNLSALLNLANLTSFNLLFVVDCCREAADTDGIRASSVLNIPENVGIVFSCGRGSMAPCDQNGPILGQGLARAIIDSRLLCRSRDAGLPIDDLFDYLQREVRSYSVPYMMELEHWRCHAGDILLPFAGVEVLNFPNVPSVDRIPPARDMVVKMLTVTRTDREELQRLNLKLNAMVIQSVGLPWPGECSIVADELMPAGCFRSKLEFRTPIPELRSGLVAICLLQSGIDFDYLVVECGGSLVPEALFGAGWQGSSLEFVLPSSRKPEIRAVLSQEGLGVWKLRLEREIVKGIRFSAVPLRTAISLLKKALVSIHWAWTGKTMETFDVEQQILDSSTDSSGILAPVARAIAVSIRSGIDPTSVRSMGILGGDEFKIAFIDQLRKLLCTNDPTYAPLRSRGRLVNEEVLKVMSVAVATHVDGPVVGMCVGGITIVVQGLSGMTVNAVCACLS